MRPLEGIKVVEFATYVAAPAATRLLADLGAEVVKVEPFAGDGFRTNGHIYMTPTEDDREDPCFDVANVGKRYVAMDLRTQQGMDAFHRLLSTADVFATNTRRPSLARLSLTYEDLKRRYPRLIYAQMLGYGENGAMRDVAGYDYTCFVARGGLMGTLYEKGAEGPFPSSPAFGDMQAATYLALAITAALRKRDITGKGDRVNVSLHGTGVYNVQIMHSASQDGFIYPTSRRYTQTPLNNMYKTQDGYWIEVCLPDFNRDFNRFITTIGRGDLADDRRFCDSDRMRNAGLTGALISIIEESFAQKTKDEWHRIFMDADIAHEVALLSQDVLKDPECWDNQFVQHHTYPTGNTRVVFNNPMRFDSVGIPEYKPTKGVGTDTEAVLRELGYSDSEIASMETAGAVKQHSATDFSRD